MKVRGKPKTSPKSATTVAKAAVTEFVLPETFTKKSTAKANGDSKATRMKKTANAVGNQTGAKVIEAVETELAVVEKETTTRTGKGRGRAVKKKPTGVAETSGSDGTVVKEKVNGEAEENGKEEEVVEKKKTAKKANKDPEVGEAKEKIGATTAARGKKASRKAKEEATTPEEPKGRVRRRGGKAAAQEVVTGDQNMEEEMAEGDETENGTEKIESAVDNGDKKLVVEKTDNADEDEEMQTLEEQKPQLNGKKTSEGGKPAGATKKSTARGCCSRGTKRNLKVEFELEAETETIAEKKIAKSSETAKGKGASVKLESEIAEDAQPENAENGGDDKGNDTGKGKGTRKASKITKKAGGRGCCRGAKRTAAMKAEAGDVVKKEEGSGGQGSKNADGEGDNAAEENVRTVSPKRRKKEEQTNAVRERREKVKQIASKMGRTSRGGTNGGVGNGSDEMDTNAAEAGEQHEKPGDTEEDNDEEEEEEAVEAEKPKKGRGKKAQTAGKQKSAKMVEFHKGVQAAASAAKTKKMLGAHVSAAGGADKAIANAVQLGCRSFALFICNQRTWKCPPMADDVVLRFADEIKKYEFPLDQIVVHSAYLVNLGSPEEDKMKQSRDRVLDECLRCERLGIKLYNFHPGSSVGKCTAEECIQLIANSMNYIIERTKSIILVLETMAGQGNVIGGKFEEIRQIIDLVNEKNRVGVCIDTCHIFASGYDIREKSGYEKTMRDFDKIIGFKYLRAVHLNDSKGDLGSNKDLHENIGKGKLKIGAFRLLMEDARFNGIPMVLETPENDYSKELIRLYQSTKKGGGGDASEE